MRLLDDQVVLWGDRRRLEQLLANLVSNGIKYNQSPVPTIDMGVSEQPPPGPGEQAPPARQTVWVRDNGIGIDRRHHRRIFQLFRRLHAREEYEGTGVGLAICNKIVTAARRRDQPGQRAWPGHHVLLQSTAGTGSQRPGTRHIASVPNRSPYAQDQRPAAGRSAGSQCQE